MNPFKRTPDVVIGDDYLHRWHLIPRNQYCNIYLHVFHGSDDDRACHDHPWHSVSILLRGRLIEFYLERSVSDADRIGSQCYKMKRRRVPRFLPVLRRATHSHRLALHSDKAVTLFITGPWLRNWGFLCPDRETRAPIKGRPSAFSRSIFYRWVPWRQFTDKSGNRIGAGCGEE